MGIDGPGPTGPYTLNLGLGLNLICPQDLCSSMLQAKGSMSLPVHTETSHTRTG